MADDYDNNRDAGTPEEPEYPARSRDSRGGEGFSDASYVPHDQLPNMPRVYSYPQPETKPAVAKPEIEKPRHRVRAVTAIALCVACVLLGAALGYLAFRGGSGAAILPEATPAATAEPAQDVAPQPTDAATPLPEGDKQADDKQTDDKQAVTAPLTADDRAAAELDAGGVYELACRQVVGVTTEVTYNNAFGMPTTSPVSGTGFILTSDGYILTNHHVIEYAVQGGYAVQVMLYNGDVYTAEIIGYESDDNDIAVLKIDAEGLEPVTLGDSNDMRVGDTVYAVGNPLGELTYTMTKGMISALDRDITTENSSTGVSSTVNMFQVDAAINSGNSGGPIYSTQGKILGIVTAKYSATGVEGLGFAIPINDAIDIANDIMENGYVRGKPYLGITVQTVSSAAARYYNMVVGAYVYTVTPDGAAAIAGLEVGDIITRLGDEEVTSNSDLTSAEKAYRAGDTVAITVYRSGEYLTLTVTFDEKVPQTVVTASQQPTALPGGVGQGFSGSW